MWSRIQYRTSRTTLCSPLLLICIDYTQFALSCQVKSIGSYIFVDEFFYPDKLGGENERRKHIDRLLNSMNEKGLTIMETVAEGIEKSRTGAK
ncbi:hypothetical protein AALB19_18475 [Oscillospiraceae bacterium 50-58]